MVFFYFFPEGIGCDIEYAYNYKEAKITQIILSIILYILFHYVAKNAVGCELFISLAVSTLFVLFMDFIRCPIEIVLFWVSLFVISLIFIYMVTDFIIVFIGLIACIPLKIIEHVKYY